MYLAIQNLLIRQPFFFFFFVRLLQTFTFSGNHVRDHILLNDEKYIKWPLMGKYGQVVKI